MNKSQQIAIMQIRAKKKVAKLLEQHEVAWRGKKPEIVSKEKIAKKDEGEE